ncbi:MAG: transketolase C-terminal domain-containing protein, partial [Burkholderiaceae bacterium]
DENEARLLLSTCFQHPGPASVRYPRGAGGGAVIQSGLDTVPIGKGVVRRQGQGIAILAFGTLLAPALQAAEQLDATVVDMRFVKPIDEALLVELAASHDAFVSLEEGAVMGGAGSAVQECLNVHGRVMPMLQLGLPDRYIDHGDQAAILSELGLDAAGIVASVEARWGKRLSGGKVLHLARQSP